MTAGAYRAKKILLVEDDLQVRVCLETMLEFDGHAVQSVDAGEAALAMLEHKKFDVVITDYWMPRMKGDELAGLIKHRWPYQPIIMMSGSMLDGCTFDNTISGVDCLLNKPFSLNELREAIVWALDIHADSQFGTLDTIGLLAGNPREPDFSKLPPGDRKTR
jgi:CheY-like chemotaxis protein